ncbi:selenoprotein S [Vanacampus margaritifer]
MDDVEITDVDENGEVLPEVDGKALKRQQHDVSPFGLMVGELARTHCWYLLPALLLLGALLLYLAKKRSGSRRASGDARSTQQDGEAVARRQEAMEASRRRMQQEQDAKAAIFREKRKQQEEEKRKQKIEEWDNMQTGKSFKGASRRLQSSEDGASSSTSTKAKSDKTPLRTSEYNPLSGESGSSCSWRPGRRGPSSSGG